MNILLNIDKLMALLLKHDEKIGIKKMEWIGAIVSAIGCFSSAISFSRQSYLFWVFLVLGIMLVIFAIQLIRLSRGGLSAKSLYEQIVELDEVRHYHSIIAIKNTFEEYPNKYLLYYDTRWGCWFFPNYKTKQTEEENIKFICAKLSHELKIDTTNDCAKLIAKDIHRKYAVPDKKEKTYEHSLYLAILCLPEDLKQDEFEYDECKYKWFSIAEMRSDKVIMEKNSQIVDFVAQNIA